MSARPYRPLRSREEPMTPSQAAEDAMAGMPAWYADALCSQTDPEAFFPEKGGSVTAAKAVCGRCPVMDLCREYAVERFEIGIWGGTSDRERTKLRTARAVAA